MTVKNVSVVGDSNEQGSARDDNLVIERLAKLAPLEYDRIRGGEATTLGIRLAVLDQMVRAARMSSANEDGTGFDDVEPWRAPVDPAALLNDISATVKRFIVCKDATANAAALWVAMTWFMDVVQVAPLAVITAPEKRCGKSQLLSILGRLAHRPIMSSNISAAALFRTIDALHPTLLIDEADSFMRKNEDLRGILDAGHTRDSAYVIRIVGEDMQPKKFDVWGAKALAGIGHLADTLMDRAIVLPLRRKLPQESVERLRHAEPELFETLARKLARFAQDYKTAVARARPDLPEDLHDRAQDNWEPLLAIADVAGGKWPDVALCAAQELSGNHGPTMTTGTALLAAIRNVFRATGKDRIATADLIEALCADTEARWATFNDGAHITSRQIAAILDGYEIYSGTVRISPSKTLKGYMAENFEDAFSRYLDGLPDQT